MDLENKLELILIGNVIFSESKSFNLGIDIVLLDTYKYNT